MRTLFRLMFWAGLSSLCGVVLLFSATTLYLSPNLPSVEQLRDVRLQTPMRVTTKEGLLIAEFGEKRRLPIVYDEIPPQFIKAILAAEDSRFFAHHGVDIKGLTRAAAQLLTTGNIKSGGSTITMQVAKNFFLSGERTFFRKFNEILLALEIERKLSKREILDLYVNKIYLGHRAYGIAAAAQVYYGKPIDALSLAQLAMIAGLPKAPSKYNPITRPERSLVRRNWILGRMRALDYITELEYQESQQALVTAEYHGQRPAVSAPYLAEMVRREMLERFGPEIYTLGYTVQTTVYGERQVAANQAVRKGLLDYDKRHGYRGVLAHVDLADTAATSEALEAIRNRADVGDLEPALVLQVEQQAARVLLKDGVELVMPWEGVDWARQHIHANRLGPVLESVADVLSRGDIVLIQRAERQQEGETVQVALLAQIPEAQGALVSFDPSNGSLQAVVGGFDYSLSKYNRATQARRQAGSGFKPFVYAAALAHGFTAATMINDAPVVFDDEQLEGLWRPENSSGRFFGPTRLRQALYKSRNLVSIRLLRQLGLQKTIGYVTRFGFDETRLPRNLSLALGSATLTPFELAAAYTVLANGGYKVEPYFIESIKDVDGEVIFQASPAIVCETCVQVANQAKEGSLVGEVAQVLQEPLALVDGTRLLEGLMEDRAGEVQPVTRYAQQIVEPRLIYILNDMLRDVIKRGTGRKARALGRADVAGKTGTTNEQKDAWFNGYNSHLVTTAWVGFDNPQTLGAREYGGTAALPVWLHYMGAVLKGLPEFTRGQPEGIVSVKIDPLTGQRARSGQSDAIFELFRTEYGPVVSQVDEQIESPYSDEAERVSESLF